MFNTDLNQKAAPADWGRDPPTQPARSPVVLANVEGIVLVKYFFGDRSESVASHFVPFKIRRVPNMPIGTKVPKSQPIVSGLIAMLGDVGTARVC